MSLLVSRSSDIKNFEKMRHTYILCDNGLSGDLLSTFAMLMK